MSKEPVLCLCHLHFQEDPPRDTHPFIHASIHPFSNDHFSCTQAVGGCPSCHRVMAALHPGQVASLSQGHNRDVFSKWEETGVPGENPCRKREMQIPHSDLDLRPSCCEAKQTFAIIDYKTTKRPSRLILILTM